MKRFPLFVFCALAAVSCVDDSAIEKEMLLMEVPSIAVNGKILMKYSSLDCQLYYRPDINEYAVVKDNGSDFFRASFDRTPSEQGQTVSGDVSWSTSTDIEKKKTVTFEVLKLEGDRIWLKAESQHLLLVLESLE